MREPHNPETPAKTIKMEPRRVFVQGAPCCPPYSSACPGAGSENFSAPPTGSVLKLQALFLARAPW